MSLPSDWRKHAQFLRRIEPAIICLAMGVLTLAIFAQTFSFQFLNFDDDIFISSNTQLHQGLHADGIAWAFTANLTHHDEHAEYWEPLTLLSRLADVQFGGMNPGAHHRTNVLLHLIAGLVLFGAMRSLLGSNLHGGLVASLFLVHPLNVEAVAWLSARKDILSGLFFFATIWSYARYARRPGWPRYFVVCACCLCADMAKPMAISLPFALILLDFWPLERLRAPFWGRAQLRVYLEKLPLIAFSIAAAVLAVIDQKAYGAMADAGAFPLSIRLGNAVTGYCGYLTQTFLPLNFSILYPHPGSNLSWPTAWASLVVLALISMACLAQAKRRPWLLVGWCWFVVVLLPVCGIVQIGEMARADRYAYIPLVGLFLAIDRQLFEWGGLKVMAPQKEKFRRIAMAIGPIGAVALLAVISWRQTKVWSDSITVFSHAIEVTDDNYIAQANLGSALFNAGRKKEGIEHYNEAILLSAPVLGQYRQKAAEAEESHQFARAIQYYGKILTLIPWNGDLHLRLGEVLLANGDYAKALVQYNEALRYDRRAIPPRVGVARVLVAQRRFVEAQALLVATAKLDPGNAAVSELLGKLPDRP